MLEDANKAVVKKTFTKSEQDYSENDISLMKTQRICPAMHRSIEVSLSEGQKKTLGKCITQVENDVIHKNTSVVFKQIF